MKTVTGLSAVILAGGKSSRMNTNKAMLHLHGKPLIQTIIERLQPVFAEIIISSNDPDLYRQFGLSVVQDIYPNRGPLAGIHAGLQNMSNDKAFFIACDMPFFEPRVAVDLLLKLQSFQIAVPKHGSYLEPLHAAYRKDCLPAIEQVLQSECPKITSVFKLLRVFYYDCRHNQGYDWERIFCNINTPNDFSNAQTAGQN